jgi:hypothetical protein
MFVLKNKFINRVLRKLNMWRKFKPEGGCHTSWKDKNYIVVFEDGGREVCRTQQEVAELLTAVCGSPILQATVAKTIQRGVNKVYNHVLIAHVYENNEPKKDN